MAIRTYDDKNGKFQWIDVDPKFAKRTKVLDIMNYYKSDNVEGVLEEIGETLNSGDIAGIQTLKNQVVKLGERTDDLESRVAYLEEFGGGGTGPGTDVEAAKVELESDKQVVCSTDATVDIYYFFTSPNTGFATAYISIDYGPSEKHVISLGRSKYTHKNFSKGEHRVDIYVVDSEGFYSNTITVYITAGGLELKSKFDDSNDLTLQDYVKIKYTVDTISNAPVFVTLTLDGKQTVVEALKGENIWDIGYLSSMGVHEATITAVSGDLVSNMLVFNLVLADSKNLYVSTTYKLTQIAVGKNLQIDYRNSMQGIYKFETEMYIDGVLTDTVASSAGYNFWNLGDQLSIGPHEFRLQSFTPDRKFASNVLIWNIEVVAEDYVPYQIVKRSLLCNFDAVGKQQDSTTRNIWADTSGNKVKCELFNFNYNTNGWIDNSLVFNGKTYAKIDLRPFELNCVDGLTIDILYKVKNVGDIHGKVLWCRNYMTPYQGVYIDTYKGNMRTNNAKIVECQFQDDTWTRMTWVVDREAGTMTQYVNAIITKVIYLSENEPFQFAGDIYLGASFDEITIYEESDNIDDNGNPIPHFASCDIKNFRVYDTALTDAEVLQNHIADIRDRDEQLAKRDLNFGESTIPIMKFEGNMEGMSGDIAKLITIDYNDPLDPSKRFIKENCQVSWQGTSSLEYPVKNYTIKLKDGGNDWLYAPKDDWIPESRYTIKANFMDSSQANNVCTARFVNDYFVKNNLLYPSQIKNDKTRGSIDGFPIRLVINGIDQGIHMFNIDRYAINNLGFADEPQIMSYEIGVNSVSGAGAFANDSWESIRNEFELRYHYAGDESIVCEQIGAGENKVTVLKSGYHNELQQMISWVCNSTDEEFLSELDEHFSVNHLIDYYLLVYFFGLVDNLGKNMVMTTWGKDINGNVIWYPMFYDCDSELGLTNDGQLRYGSGIDMETGDFNTSNSRLWTKLKRNFNSQITERYISMRSNGHLTYDNMMKYFESGMISTIGEVFYNLDQRLKYANEDNKAWIYMCNGSRLEHTKRWIKERITYLDSVFEYGNWMKSMIVRSNDITGQVSLFLKSYTPMHVTVAFSDQATGKIKRYCDKDKWYEFKGIIENEKDNNITIYGANNIMYIDGIEQLNCSALHVSNAENLVEINIPGSKNIQILELGSNDMLQKLNCKNCENLGINDNYKSVNLQGCINLRHLDLSGTKLAEVVLNPSGGSLEYFDLSNTLITNLSIHGQEFLPEIKLDNCSDLSTVNISECNSLTRLSLPNSKLSEFLITDCLKLDYLDISYTGYLKSLALHGCKNLTTLKMAGMTNSAFKEVDLRTLEQLEELDISKCIFLNNVRFAEGYDKIKRLQLSESAIKTFQFGLEEIPSYLDLAPFTLEYVNFNNCTEVQHIKNINLYATASMSPFYNCINLHTIQGTVNLTGSIYRGFYNCKKLATWPTLNLNRVTSISECFDGCAKMTFNQMRTILNSLTNCTEFYRGFCNCSGVKCTEYPADLFKNNKAMTSLYYTFLGTGMSGQLKPGIFDPLTNLVTIRRPFPSISGYIPDGLFVNNTRLTTCAELFQGMTGLNLGPQGPLFPNCPSLSAIYGLFSGCTNAVIELSDESFANNPNLTNMDHTFQNCKNLLGSLPPNLLKNKSRLNTAYSCFEGCTGLTGEIPDNFFEGCTALANINYFFAYCTGLTGPIKTNLWTNSNPNKSCNNIVYANALFLGCTGLGGDPSNLQEIPEDFFDKKYRLAEINGMFRDCTNLSFTLTSRWFRDLRQLTKMNNLFNNCQGLSGVIPEKLFVSYDAEGNEMESTSLNEAQGMFTNCRQLSGTIPADLFQRFLNIRKLDGFFENCYHIEGGIPEELFSKCFNVVSMNNMFDDACKIGRYQEEFTEEDPWALPPNLFDKCVNLLSTSYMFYMWDGHGTSLRGELPPDLFKNCTKLQNTEGMFEACSLLKGGLPNEMFRTNKALTNVSNMFWACSGLNGELGATLFTNTYNPKITTFYQTFSGCSNLTGTAPALWTMFPKATMGMCFRNCTKLSNYDSIPNTWK